MSLKNLLTIPVFVLVFTIAKSQTKQSHYTVAIRCSCPSTIEGAIASNTDSSVTVISSNFSTIDIPFKSIKKVAIYPPKHGTIPGLLYVGGVGLIGGSFFRDNIRSGVNTALSGLGVIILGYVAEKILYKPAYKKTIREQADLSNLKAELQKFQLNILVCSAISFMQQQETGSFPAFKRNIPVTSIRYFGRQ